ncbi:hypothetical protein GQ44DRAFT_785963 [Phaeosphaeriaceae sp. PMI808]|nr:hypothetical protein GQ44DRAFT_785963 [Phaeosphaeriaceae sp. PMI808]
MASLTSESSSSNNLTVFCSSEYPADVADNDTLYSAKCRRIRPLVALNTWKAGRPRRPGEPEYKDKNRIWYCAHSTCNYPHPTWSTHVIGNARTHMLKAYGVIIAEEESLVKQAISKAMNMSIKELFKKADEEI